jgi:hypothetical protein
MVWLVASNQDPREILLFGRFDREYFDKGQNLVG